LLRNGTYLFTTIALSVLFFVVSGIQYWVSDYLSEVLDVPITKVYVYFAVVVLTAPIIGALLSGYVT
jgi:sugar phosphate permease